MRINKALLALALGFALAHAKDEQDATPDGDRPDTTPPPPSGAAPVEGDGRG